MNLRLQIEESIGATLVFCAYVITANIGLAINSVTHYASAVWPPTGIAIAAVVIGGKKMAIPIGLAAYVVNFQIDHSVIVATSIACGNSLEAITGAWMVSQLKTFDWTFNNAKQTIKFATTVVLVSTLISCTIGTSILLLNGIIIILKILILFYLLYFSITIYYRANETHTHTDY